MGARGSVLSARPAPTRDGWLSYVKGTHQRDNERINEWKATARPAKTTLAQLKMSSPRAHKVAPLNASPRRPLPHLALQAAKMKKTLPHMPEPTMPTPLMTPRGVPLSNKPKHDEKEIKRLIDMTQNLINSRFADMHKAFHHIDVDNTGYIDAAELKRAMRMWNVELSERELDALMSRVDTDGDGQVDYTEFTDHLARDTVAPAAMFKHDMQSLEAMGVDSQEMLAEMLGHKKVKNFAAPKNVDAAPKKSMRTAVSNAMAERNRVIDMAKSAINSRFADMHKAFHHIDVDNTGYIDASELKRALLMWNVELSDNEVQTLMSIVDTDSNGEVNCTEFVDHLARDTVAPAAMFKHDMQSLEAMGVDSQEMLAEQLGHKKIKNYKIGE